MNSDFPHSIARPVYLDKVAPFIGKNLIKVFTGQRRVGKSFLLFQLMEIIQKQDAKGKILYINACAGRLWDSIPSFGTRK